MADSAARKKQKMKAAGENKKTSKASSSHGTAMSTEDKATKLQAALTYLSDEVVYKMSFATMDSKMDNLKDLLTDAKELSDLQRIVGKSVAKKTQFKEFIKGCRVNHGIAAHSHETSAVTRTPAGNRTDVDMEGGGPLVASQNDGEEEGTPAQTRKTSASARILSGKQTRTDVHSGASPSTASAAQHTIPTQPVESTDTVSVEMQRQLKESQKELRKTKKKLVRTQAKLDKKKEDLEYLQVMSRATAGYVTGFSRMSKESREEIQRFLQAVKEKREREEGVQTGDVEMSETQPIKTTTWAEVLELGKGLAEITPAMKDLEEGVLPSSWKGWMERPGQDWVDRSSEATTTITE